MKKKLELKTRTFYHDVTEMFDSLKEGDEDFTLSHLKKIVDDAIVIYGPNADLQVEIDGDDYYGSSWTWNLTQERQETEVECKERLKKELEREKAQKKREAQEEKEERKEYLRLKKKFEGK